MRMDLVVLNSFDLIITTSTSECVSEAEEQMLHPKRRTTCVVCAVRENLESE